MLFLTFFSKFHYIYILFHITKRDLIRYYYFINIYILAFRYFSLYTGSIKFLFDTISTFFTYYFYILFIYILLLFTIIIIILLFIYYYYYFIYVLFFYILFLSIIYLHIFYILFFEHCFYILFHITKRDLIRYYCFINIYIFLLK